MCDYGIPPPPTPFQATGRKIDGVGGGGGGTKNKTTNKQKQQQQQLYLSESTHKGVN